MVLKLKWEKNWKQQKQTKRKFWQTPVVVDSVKYFKAKRNIEKRNALNITRKSNFILNPLVRKKSKKLTDKKMRTNDDDVKTQVQKKKKSKSISQKQTKWIQ
jgi:hypothetical protein